MDRINIETIRTAITEEVNGDCENYAEIINDQTFRIPAEKLGDVVDLLIETFGCRHLSAITAQQREGQEDEIEVLYHFWVGKGFSLMMTLPAQSPELPTIVTKLLGADFYEREAAEMFGITFLGREETPPLLLPDDWDQGPPFIGREVKDE